MGLFSRRDKTKGPQPQVPQAGASSGPVQFLIPREVTWTIEDVEALMTRGEWEEALERWRVLLTPFEDPKFAPQIRALPAHRVVWLRIGLCSRHLGRYDEALEAYEKAELLANEAGDRSMLLEITNCRGVVHRNRGEVDEALQWFRRALPEAEAQGDAGLVTAVYDNLAHCHLDRGDLQSALREAEAAYARFASDPSAVNAALQSRVLGNLGAIYSELGDDERAAAFYERGLSKAREAGDVPQESLILGNLARLQHA